MERMRSDTGRVISQISLSPIRVCSNCRSLNEISHVPERATQPEIEQSDF